MSPFFILGELIKKEPAAPLTAIVPCMAQTNNECFIVRDKTTGAPLVNWPYRIEGPKTIVEGTTDDQGRTVRVETGASKELLKLFVLEAEPDLSEASAHSESCT